MKDLIGWGSALVLMAALWKQLARQWSSSSIEGVSSWLFVGQALASTGFIVYSALLGDPVFIVVNSLLLCTALAGWLTLLIKRSKPRNGPSDDTAAVPPPSRPGGRLDHPSTGRGDSPQ